jgi:hypothetical protein
MHDVVAFSVGFYHEISFTEEMTFRSVCIVDYRFNM